MNLEHVTVAVLKEIMPEERRVAATPETVSRMIAAGARVRVETGAGEGSFFPDADYRSAGAEVCPDAQAACRSADVVLKVKEPRPDERTGLHEADRLEAGQCLVCFLHPASPSNRDMINRLARRGVTALTLDGIPRIARAQPMDALTSMSTVAGYKGFLMAADLLPKFIPFAGTAAGPVPPASALIVGAGVAGLQALAMAKRMGARVSAIDIRAEAREQAGSLGAEVMDPGVPPDLAEHTGGYARALPSDWLKREREAIAPLLAKADLVMLSALVPGRVAPVLVTDEMIAGMQPGSVVVDIAVDQGGNCDATEPGRIAARHGVQIIGIANIPGRVPSTATWMYARNVLNFLDFLAPAGAMDVNREDEILAGTLTTHGGRVVHTGALESWASLDGGGAA